MIGLVLLGYTEFPPLQTGLQQILHSVHQWSFKLQNWITTQGVKHWVLSTLAGKIESSAPLISFKIS